MEFVVDFPSSAIDIVVIDGVDSTVRCCDCKAYGKNSKSVSFLTKTQTMRKLDPIGSTVRYEMMKLCTGSVQDTMRRQQLVIDDTGPVEDIHAFIYCKKWRSGQVLLMPDSLTH